MIVEGKQKLPGVGVVVKQQLNGHGPHANHRDPRNGPWSDLGSYPPGSRQIVGNPPIPWVLEWRKIVEVNGRENSVSHLARRKGDRSRSGDKNMVDPSEEIGEVGGCVGEAMRRT
uniref:Uncharacterized protein n=1 Tax=Peronospora matthiolae TaxID=2874970 RepID=A0AAV1VLK0_9STRA